MGDQLVSWVEQDEQEEEPTGSQEVAATMTTLLEQREAIVDGALTFEEVLHQILNKGLGAVRATGGSLMLIDSRGEWLEIKARLGPPHPEREEGRKFKVGDGSIAGR